MTIPLKNQVEEVGREVRHRREWYPDLVARGRLRPETAQRKLAELEAAYATMQWLELNMGWIRREAELRLAHERAEAERKDAIAEAEDWPETQAARETFPDAEVTGVRELEGEE